MDQIIVLLSDPAKVLSILALAFTLFSFWWMNWRHGRLHVGKPRSGSIHIPAAGNMVIRLPFSFFNDGPTPIIISNLRLVFEGEDLKPLFFSATSKAYEKDLERQMAMQIAVSGRQTMVLVCEFQQDVERFVFEGRDYTIKLQGKLGNSPEWKTLTKFVLNLKRQSKEAVSNRLVAFDNMAED